MKGFLDLVLVRRIAAGLAAAAVSAALMGGCSGREEASVTALPEIVVGSDEYAPFNYIGSNGQPAGIDVELAREAFSRMGYNVVFQNIVWDEKDNYLADGSVDCLWGCFSMNGREDSYAWAGPYMKSRQAVAVRADSDISCLADLEGKRVAVLSSTQPEKLLLEHSSGNIPQVAEVYCFEEMDMIFAALRKKYVHAMAGHESALRELIGDSADEFRILDESMMEASLGVAFSSDNTDIAAELEQTLRDMKQEGFTASVVEKYGIDSAALEVDDLD